MSFTQMGPWWQQGVSQAFPGVPGMPTPIQTMGNAMNPAPAPAPDPGTSDVLKQYLDSLGLGGLDDWANQMLLSGASPAQIEVELYNQPAFQQAFPEYAALKNAGLPTDITPADILSVRSSYRAALHAQGIDTTNLTAADYTPLFVQQVSPSEFSQRLNDYRTVNQVYGPYLRQAFEQHAGIPNVPDSDLYGMMSGLKPELIQQYSAKTGTPPPANMSFAGIEQAMKQAQAQNDAAFKGGGSVTEGTSTSGAEEAAIQRRATTFG